MFSFIYCWFSGFIIGFIAMGEEQKSSNFNRILGGGVVIFVTDIIYCFVVKIHDMERTKCLIKNQIEREGPNYIPQILFYLLAGSQLFISEPTS